MHLIIGGAYQGKLDFAKKHFKLSDCDIETCTDTEEPCFGSKCVYCLENFALFCIKNGTDPIPLLEATSDKWKNSVLICTDIFCGVVPIDREMRAWREATGRMCGYLSRKAETTTRLFCGLPQKLK